MKKLSNIRCQQVHIPPLAVCATLSLGLGVSSAQVYSPPTLVPPAYAATAYVPDSDQDPRYYLNSDLGLSIVPDFQSPRFGFPGDFHADDGVRIDLDPGYNFLNAGRLTLAGEFETGVTYDRISSVSIAGFQTPMRGDYYQVPLLVNLVASFHPISFVVPYLGAGGGGDCSFARIRTPFFFGYSSSNSDQVDPAVQAEAGVRFPLNPVCDLGVGYKFLAAFPSQGYNVPTHAIFASLTLRF